MLEREAQHTGLVNEMTLQGHDPVSGLSVGDAGRLLKVVCHQGVTNSVVKRCPDLVVLDFDEVKQARHILWSAIVRETHTKKRKLNTGLILPRVCFYPPPNPALLACWARVSSARPVYP